LYRIDDYTNYIFTKYKNTLYTNLYIIRDSREQIYNKHIICYCIGIKGTNMGKWNIWERTKIKTKQSFGFYL